MAQAIRLPLMEQQEQVMTALAIALYARGILSFGKARELTSLNKAEFGLLIGRRVFRVITTQDVADDIAYARGQ